MTELPFTDADGRHWRVVDYCVVIDAGTVKTEKRLPIGSSKAECRAFVPAEFSGTRADVLVYHFPWPLGREPDILALQQQLDDAYPATSTRIDRLTPKPHVDRSVWRTEILKAQWAERGWPWPTFTRIVR